MAVSILGRTNQSSKLLLIKTLEIKNSLSIFPILKISITTIYNSGPFYPFQKLLPRIRSMCVLRV